MGLTTGRYTHKHPPTHHDRHRERMGRCCQLVMGPAGVGKSTYCKTIQVPRLRTS